MTTEFEDVAPAFLKAITELAGSGEELEFERRGSGDSTYSFHGRLVAVNAHLGTISIHRTRTHAGEVHEMGLRYFLCVTHLNGARLVNQGVYDRNCWFRARQQARIDAVEAASLDPTYRPGDQVLRSTFVGTGQGTLEGYPEQRYVYQDIECDSRRVGLIAKSSAAAQQFMAMQDIFMPLDNMLWHAIDARVLWPAGIAFDKQEDPQAWTVDWLELYETLAGIPSSALERYLYRMRSRYVEFISFTDVAADDLQLLIERGLLVYEEAPNTLEETLGRVPVGGLRQLLREAGSTFKASTRAALVQELRREPTPGLQDRAGHLMRAPRMQLRAPCGLAIEAFDRAVGELRGSIFLMRQWLRGTRDIAREEALHRLADVA